MTSEPTKFEINGRTYTIGSWGVDKALETMVWLTKTFGEGFLSLLMAGEGVEDAKKLLDGTEVDDEGEIRNKTEKELKEDKALIMEFAGKIREQLDAKEYVKYSKIIIEGIRCGGAPINFNTHFMGKMAELHQVMLQCLRHQYGDFLEGSAENAQ
jgi:hypothetical protein